MKSILIKISLLILSFLIVFAAGEVALRLKREKTAEQVFKYDSKTGLLILDSNYEFDVRNKCFDTHVKANSEGFNDSEFSPEKPDDVFRIAILGDSFVEAFQVPIENSFQYLLENKLNEIPGQKKKVEIYSFGHGGNGTFKNYLYLNQYALKHKPDLVILAFLPANDFGNDYQVNADIYGEDGKVRTALREGQKLIYNSVFLQWLNEKWQIISTQKMAYSKAQVPFDFQVFLEEYPQGWSSIWDMEEGLLKEFKNKVEENGAKFMLVSVNDIWRTHPELTQKDDLLSQMLNSFDFDFDKPEKILENFTQEENIPFLNLLPFFKENIEGDELVFNWPCEGHWNKKGHEMAAESLFDYLTQGKGQELLNELK
ncbi:MAG: SGNH/GDSL hydrolase family protein [Candidatus Pacebacteria bacterium]|nr:SGNH/GDSL hydrolase family protein [Candidatus Paceibacterota bacterium]